MLSFDIDGSEMREIAQEFAATERQVGQATNRALRRTAATLRRLSSRGLQSELGLRNATALRRRIKEYRLSGNAKGVKLWYGANDLPLSAFRGRARRVPGGVKFGEAMLHGAFMASRGGRRGIYERVGATSYPIREVRRPVADRMMIFLEDEVFVDLDTIFFRHFRSEIRARTILGVGS